MNYRFNSDLPEHSLLDLYACPYCGAGKEFIYDIISARDELKCYKCGEEFSYLEMRNKYIEKLNRECEYD